MTNKCLMSFVVYMFFSAICLISMHIMLLANVNKYVGVSIGIGILVASFIIFIIFHKKHGNIKLTLPFLFVSAIGCGLSVSSLYVHLDIIPAIIHSFSVWIIYVILFLIYCLLTNILLFRRYPRICLAIYGIIVLICGIIGICFLSVPIFSLVLMMFIVFIAYLSTLVIHSADRDEHNNILALVSFIGLFVVIIVVLIIISEGDGVDVINLEPDNSENKASRKNPYDFV